jgi:hypothetical protein
MATLRIAANVQARLRAAFVEDSMLAEALRRVRPQAVPGVADRWRCVAEITVPRQEDPEFAEARVVTVDLVRQGNDWEVVSVEGLPGVD